MTSLHKHCTLFQQTTSFCLFSVLQYPTALTVWTCSMKSTSSMAFAFQNIVIISLFTNYWNFYGVEVSNDEFFQVMESNFFHWGSRMHLRPITCNHVFQEVHISFTIPFQKLKRNAYELVFFSYLLWDQKFN